MDAYQTLGAFSWFELCTSDPKAAADIQDPQGATLSIMQYATS